MPTDPFVASDLDDHPRQQQNLPSGAAYPPARGWRGGRPGELAPGRPSGPLLGSPGPDVGFGYTLAQRSKERLRVATHEHQADAVAVVAEVAMKRAALLGRAPVVADIDVAVALLGYNGDADPEFVERRVALVHGADHDYVVRRSFVDAVPEEMLRLRIADITQQTEGWRGSVRPVAPDAHETAVAAPQ